MTRGLQKYFLLYQLSPLAAKRIGEASCPGPPADLSQCQDGRERAIAALPTLGLAGSASAATEQEDDYMSCSGEASMTHDGGNSGMDSADAHQVQR